MRRLGFLNLKEDELRKSGEEYDAEIKEAWKQSNKLVIVLYIAGFFLAVSLVVFS